MFDAIRRWVARRRSDRPLSKVEELSAAMRQQEQIAELERYQFQRQRERMERTGNFVEDMMRGVPIDTRRHPEEGATS